MSATTGRRECDLVRVRRCGEPIDDRPVRIAQSQPPGDHNGRAIEGDARRLVPARPVGLVTARGEHVERPLRVAGGQPALRDRDHEWWRCPVGRTPGLAIRVIRVPRTKVFEDRRPDDPIRQVVEERRRREPLGVDGREVRGHELQGQRVTLAVRERRGHPEAFEGDAVGEPARRDPVEPSLPRRAVLDARRAEPGQALERCGAVAGRGKRPHGEDRGERRERRGTDRARPRSAPRSTAAGSIGRPSSSARWTIDSSAATSDPATCSRCQSSSAPSGPGSRAAPRRSRTPSSGSEPSPTSAAMAIRAPIHRRMPGSGSWSSAASASAQWGPGSSSARVWISAAAWRARTAAASCRRTVSIVPSGARSRSVRRAPGRRRSPWRSRGRARRRRRMPPRGAGAGAWHPRDRSGRARPGSTPGGLRAAARGRPPSRRAPPDARAFPSQSLSRSTRLRSTSRNVVSSAGSGWCSIHSCWASASNAASYRTSGPANASRSIARSKRLSRTTAGSRPRRSSPRWRSSAVASDRATKRPTIRRST